MCSGAKEVIPRQTYRTWLDPTEAHSLTDKTLVVGVHSAFAIEWIGEKYASLLEDIGEEALGVRLQLKLELRDTSPRIEFPAINPLPEPSLYDVIPLNRRYTFDRFVIGGNNQFATAACQAVIARPGRTYNPLFIWGGTGLGKTHLLHATGHALLQHSPNLRVEYIPSEQFTNELIDAIRTGQTKRFRERYRQIDVLLVDDIQFIANKEGTQEEFFHTFNTLYDIQKQIVITSDRSPQDIRGIWKRLVHRFEWGLVTDIQPPLFETRAAILRQKAEEEGIALPEDVLHFFARHRTDSVRQLEGALIKLLAYCSLTRREISLASARTALQHPPGGGRDFPKHGCARRGNFRRGRCMGPPVRHLAGETTPPRGQSPRQVAMYLLKTNLDLPYADIGNLFGGRSHSTVIHAVNKVEAGIGGDRDLRKKVTHLRQTLFLD